MAVLDKISTFQKKALDRFDQRMTLYASATIASKSTNRSYENYLFAENRNLV
jgi:hypothetical protein